MRIGFEGANMAADDEPQPVRKQNVEPKSGSSSKKQPIHTLKLLFTIKDAQKQHGLRHGDYQRYRSYCSRRIRRLRKALNFSQSNRNRYQARKVTQNVVNDVRFLYIPLMTAERAWSYAVQLKQESNTEPRKRFHLVCRLRNAAKYAKVLEKLCESHMFDARTKLESQAYSYWMTASLLFEVHDWQEAMQTFRKAQGIYEKLAEVVKDDERILYSQRVEEITPNLRYCAYNIGDESALQDLQQMRRLAGEDFLADKIDSLIAQTQDRQAATLSDVTWQLRKVPVKHEKVRLFLLNANELEKDRSRTVDMSRKVSSYEKLLMDGKDAIQLLANDLNLKSKSQSGGDMGQVSNIQYLHSYLVYLRITLTVERNRLLVQNMLRKLEAKQLQEGEEGKKGCRPQDFVRIYETIILSLLEAQRLPGVEEDSDLHQQISTQILVYKAYKCYYIAKSFRVNKKWMEAIGLYERANRYLTQALPFSDTLTEEFLEELKRLQKLVDGQKYSAHALAVLGREGLVDQVEHLKIEDKKPLVERLDVFSNDTSLLTNQPNVARFPPDFQAISCKPLFFDLALNHVTLPSVEDSDAKKGGGLTGMVKGWLWGGGAKK